MKNLLTIVACLLFIFVFVGLMPVHGEEEIYDSVLRLHVLANSDSAEDQALKLSVRDRILLCSSSILKDCQSREDAEAALITSIPTLEAEAKDVIESEGFDYSVRIELCEEEYPTKSYEAFCFPGGTYLSLKVLIGNAEGENWWCVLFPPLCLSAATAYESPQDAFISVGLTDEQYKIITETDSTTYQVRFKILETIEDTRKDINKFFSKN